MQRLAVVAALGAVLALVLPGCLGDGSSARAPLPLTLQVLDTGYAGNEPTVGVDAEGRVFVTAIGGPVEDTFRMALVLRSADGGASWQTVDTFPVTSDPILHVDAGSQRVYRAHMFDTVCTNLAWSDDGGTAWVQRPLACGEGRSNDFIKLGSGRPGPEDPDPDGVSHVLYLCHNRNAAQAATTVCAMSRDGGLTWPKERVVADWARDGAGGVTSFPVVAADGTVVVPVTGGTRLGFAVSRDSGSSWEVRHLPFTDGDYSVTPRMAFDGTTAYALWATFGRVWLGRSEDLHTWTRTDVTPDGVASATHLGMDVVGPGRVAYAFLGASSYDNPTKAPQGTEWRLHAGAWADGEVYQAVGDVAHVGTICYGGSGCPRNLGDFFDAAAGPDGSLWYSFVDGCDDCGQAQATGAALRLARITIPA